MNLKGIVQPKIIIQSVSSHPYAYGGVGGANILASESNTTEDNGDYSSDVKKQQKKMNVGACWHFDDTTRAVRRHVMFSSSEDRSVISWVALDSPAALFAPETVFCGLKLFTHTSIVNIVVSR